jgi:hypothetical protein
MFSYSRPGQPWFAWEWLSDIIFASIHALGGLRAVVLFTIVLLTFTSMLLFRLLRRKSNPVVAILVTMLAAGASSIHWLARPHLFTLLFLVLFYGALERVREGQSRIAGIRYLAILPLATVLWTNLHGGFITGIIMIGAYGCGEVLRIAMTGDDGRRTESWRKALGYFLSAGACLAASLINPYTYHLHIHMVEYLRDPWNSQHILEFLSPTFHHPTAIFFEGMLALALAAAVSAVSKGQFTEILLILVWAHGALLAARNIPIFMIAASLPVAAAIEDWLRRAEACNLASWLRTAIQKFNRIAIDTAESESVSRWHLISVAAVALIAALIWAPNPPKTFRAEFDPGRYPAGALATLKLDPAAHIFTHDEWGDYLIWTLYPSQKVFVDGRSDFYGNSFEEKYIDVLNVKYGWDATLERFGVDTVLMPPDAALTGALKESRRWHVVYDDGVAVVFRSAPQASSDTNTVVANDGAAGARDIVLASGRGTDLKYVSRQEENRQLRTLRGMEPVEGLAGDGSTGRKGL